MNNSNYHFFQTSSYENIKAGFTSRDHDQETFKPTVYRYRLKGSAASNRTSHNYTDRTRHIDISPREDSKLNEAKKSVHVPSIFRGTTIKNYVKEFNLEERARRERQRLAAIKIQQ